MAATFPPQQPPAGYPPTPAQPPQPLPWEQPGYPALEALYETAKLFITRPSEAFARMSVTGDLGRPLLFVVIFGWIGIVAQQLYQLTLGHPWMRMLPWLERGAAVSLPIFWIVVSMLVAPLFVLLAVFIWAAILHLFLMIAGGATAGFTATVRVVCYAGTTQVFQVLPVCGGFIAGIWAIVLQIVGLAMTHRTTQGRAALAVLLPIALCCTCIAIAAAMFGAAILAAIASLR